MHGAVGKGALRLGSCAGWTVPARQTLRPFSSDASKFRSTIFTEPADNTITLEDDSVGAESAYRGSLLVVPTPLGNLGDMSLRQYEALTAGCDLIACEDTRKTGKMMQMLRDKRVQNKFFEEFGVNVEQWVSNEDDQFGHNINQMKKGAGSTDFDGAEDDLKSQLKTEMKDQTHREEVEEEDADTRFYLSEEEFNDQRLLNRVQQANSELQRLFESADASPSQQREEALQESVRELLEKFETEVEKNKFGDLEREMRKERDDYLEKHMTKEDKEFVE